MDNGLRVVEKFQAERADNQAGGQIAQHRAQPQTFEQRHSDNCRRQ